jgi:pimeloyl-ACP methyl ester carboxylesterase
MPYCNTLFYRRYDGGAGASSHPTILLHGLGGSHLSWPPQLRRISGQVVYALDLPGHGQSTECTCVDMDCYIIALKHFFKCMRFSQVNLVGHSMGAMIAYAYASENPDQIHSLALLSVGKTTPYARQLELGFIREKTRSQSIGILQQYGFHPSFPNYSRMRLLDPLNQARLSLLHADAMVCANFVPQSYAHPSGFPILLITGKEDELVPLSGVRSLFSRKANVKLKTIADCGHFVIYEKPEITGHHLRHFLSGQVG